MLSCITILWESQTYQIYTINIPIQTLEFQYDPYFTSEAWNVEKDGKLYIRSQESERPKSAAAVQYSSTAESEGRRIFHFIWSRF